MSKKILIVDDAPVIREFLEEFFTDNGYEVETAENGRIGYEMAVNEDYALIICDVHMPEMSGVDLVQNLRRKKPDSKIIIMDSMPGKHARQATESGALGCLAKPFDLNELRSLIKKYTSPNKVSVK